VANEILKCETLLDTLHSLLSVCFKHGIIPSAWCRNIIHPILKKGKDFRNPLDYRGIAVMSTVAKVFTSIMNTRLKTFMEKEMIFSDTQNGFRALRSCLDHIYSLTAIIKKYIRSKSYQPTAVLWTSRRHMTVLITHFSGTRFFNMGYMEGFTGP